MSCTQSDPDSFPDKNNLMHFNITISPDEGFWKGHPKSLASVTSVTKPVSVSCVPQCPEAVHRCILLQTLHSQEQATPSCSTLLPCILTRPNIIRNFFNSISMGASFEATSFMRLFQAPKVKCAELKISMGSAAQMFCFG